MVFASTLINVNVTVDGLERIALLPVVLPVLTMDLALHLVSACVMTDG